METFLSWLINLPWGTIWQALSAFAALTAVILIYIAIRRLQFDAWLKAQTIFTKKEFIDSRHIIFSYLKSTEEEHDEKDKKHFELVCRTMDEFCRLARYLGESKMIKTWYDPIGKAWFVAENWVNNEREICNNWETKWDAFQRIGSKALKKLEKENRYPELLDDKSPPS